ncbi:unnamed protein product [Linum tenue]|uniref:MADS-box domain-containing protein n=1 Tax=Linum tenue TaxID=586396 RepID=A0AAV0M5H0_9ROSI|nr:unnamed protein product [Linum tenue]
MGHKRVKMELIKNERNRIQTFKKRKANLMKKMSEFSILCGVEACLITFGPTRTTEAAKEEEDNELETWPSDPRAVRAMIQRYRTSDGPKRTYQLSDYFAEKKKRVDLELAKINRQIYRRRFAAGWDSRLDGFSADQLTVLLGQLDAKLKLADRKLASFSSVEAARRCNRLEFDFSPMVVQLPPVIPAAVVGNSDIMGFGWNIEKSGFCDDYLEVRQQQQDNSSQSTHQQHQQEQEQSSFMALLNANSSEAGNEIQYPNLHSHIGLQQLLPDVNSSGGCYSAAAAAAAAEEESSPNELSNTGYSIDFELFNHQVTKPVPDSQMMMMTTTRFGGYGQDSETYGSFGCAAAAATYPNPWGLDSYGEFGMINYSHDWSTMSYMNPPLSSFQQILQQPHQLQFPTTTAAGFSHAPMTGSSGFNQK